MGPDDIFPENVQEIFQKLFLIFSQNKIFFKRSVS
jgi:hypothetical protein